MSSILGAEGVKEVPKKTDTDCFSRETIALGKRGRLPCCCCIQLGIHQRCKTQQKAASEICPPVGSLLLLQLLVTDVVQLVVDPARVHQFVCLYSRSSINAKGERKRERQNSWQGPDERWTATAAEKGERKYSSTLFRLMDAQCWGKRKKGESDQLRNVSNCPLSTDAARATHHFASFLIN